MLPIILLLFTILTTVVASSTLIQFPRKLDNTNSNNNNNAGFKLPLIPPTSPHSPFYPQLLVVNNLTQTQNQTLTRTHYQKWVETKRTNKTILNNYAPIIYNKDAYFFVTELLIGNPVQLVYGIFDTGSDIVWFQCEGMAGKGSKLAHYNQSKSSSYKGVDCRDSSRCQTNRGDMKCSTSGDSSCVYEEEYLDKSFSRGVMASDVITLQPDMKVMQDFVFGCSSNNPIEEAGIVGASNSFFSMPKQLSPNTSTFSYCISGSPTKINYAHFGPEAILQGNTVKITPIDFLYYMDVIAVQVNGVDLNIDPSLFAPSPKGDDGFVIDSGYAITSLADIAFDVLKKYIQGVLGNAVGYSEFEICYSRTKFGEHWPYKPRPKIGVRFRDWVLELEESNVWYSMGNSGLECLQITRTGDPPRVSFLGAEQLFDVNVGHDPDNNLLYLKPMSCPITQ